MMVQQQKLLKRDLRCRLPVPSVYVPNIYIGWHWDPDALARWNTVIPTCRLVSRVAPPCAEANAGVQDCAGNCCGKPSGLHFYFRMVLKDNCCKGI